MKIEKYFTTKDEEKSAYIRTSQNRLDAVVSILRDHFAPHREEPLKVLEIGRMPDNLMTMAISNIIDKNIHVVEAPNAVWPGEHNAIESTDESFCCDGRSFNFHITRLNIERDALPYKEESFDLILCCEVIEHLLFDPVHAIFELGRVLKKGGVVVISMPNALCWLNIAVMLANNPPPRPLLRIRALRKACA